MKPGDIVKLKGMQTYATVHYSTFGISLHTWDEDHGALGKTLGDDPEVYKEYWEVVDSIPDTHYYDTEIGVIRREKVGATI